MSRFLRDLRRWQSDQPLPAAGALLFYDPGQDEEFALSPEQLSGVARLSSDVLVRLSLAQARNLIPALNGTGNYKVVPGATYLISGFPGGLDVAVMGVETGYFASEGYVIEVATKKALPVAVDVRAGTIGPRSGAEQLPAPYPFTNTATVTITHNLGRAVVPAIYNPAGGLIRGQVTALNPNTLQILFSQPLSGTVVLR